MKKRAIALICALVLSALVVMGVGAYLKYEILKPLKLAQDKNIVELPFLLIADAGLRYDVQLALNGETETSGADLATEPTTVPATVPTTAPTTEQSTEPPTEPDTEPSTEPTFIPTEDPDDPNHTHSYSSTVVAPTCTEKGYTLYRCACGDEYHEDEVPAAGHSFDHTVVKPTCTEQGYTWHSCTVCAYGYADSQTNAKGHNYTTTVVEPTVEAEGYDLHICSVCGDSYRDNYTPKIGYETDSTEPPETEPDTGDKGYSYPNYDFSSGAVSDSWYDNVLFIGDSRTVGLRDYARSGNAEYFCSVGMSVFNFDERNCSDTNFPSQTLESLLGSRTYDKIFISLGINECGYSTSSLMKAYGELVDMVRSYQPDAKIILQGIMMVTSKYASGKSYFQPSHINSINDRIKGLSNGSDIFYIDVNEYFANADGYLYSDITGDGCHLYASYYKVWAQWISYAVGRLGI